MKWKKEEIETAIELLKSGNDFAEIGISLGRTKKSIKEKLNELGYNQSDYVKKEFYEIRNCECCKKEFRGLISDERKFCSQNCSASFNNKLRKRKAYSENKRNKCLNCKNIVKNKFCNSKCHGEYRRKIIFKKIENGDINIYFGSYKNYLISKFGEKCMECGWDKVNPFSKKIPIELEHIDGNSENNKLENLKLLCPNCHSLTSTYKALNKGNGRYKRMEKYKEGKSY
jgi:hypothetical protein